MLFEKFEKLWKIWLFVPFIILLASAAFLLNSYINTGDFVSRDVELVGGNMITMKLEGPVDFSALQSALPYAKLHVTTGMNNELLVETASDIDVEKVIADLSSFGLSNEYEIKTVGPALGDIFWRQAQLAIIIAFILMSIVVFILFRKVVPSSIVIFSVVVDVIATLAVMNIIGISLSMPVLAALLMIIGYSVDTDILLTSELLKARGMEISESIKNAMTTGLTMSFTTLAALSALYFVSGDFVLGQIALVLMIGIIVDIFVTWMGNTSILKLWLMRNEKNT